MRCFFIWLVYYLSNVQDWCSVFGVRANDPQEQTRGSSVINAVPAGHITCEEKKEGDKKFLLIRQPKLKSARKIEPFLVRIEETDNQISFVYDSEFVESFDAATKLRDKLLEVIHTSDKWLGIKDLTGLVQKSEKPVRDQIRVLEKNSLIQSRKRSEILTLKFPTSDRSGGHQEKLYFRGDNEEDSNNFGVF